MKGISFFDFVNMGSFTKLLLWRHFLKRFRKYFKIIDWLKSPKTERVVKNNVPQSLSNALSRKSWRHGWMHFRIHFSKMFEKWGAHPKQTFSPGKRTKKKEIPYSHKKKLMLSCDPLAMNVPFEICLPFSKPSMLGNTVYEKQKELVQLLSTYLP